jgi:hypothetical protein
MPRTPQRIKSQLVKSNQKQIHPPPTLPPILRQKRPTKKKLSTLHPQEHSEARPLLQWPQLSAPILRAVVDMQNFDRLGFYLIDHYVG